MSRHGGGIALAARQGKAPVADEHSAAIPFHLLPVVPVSWLFQALPRLNDAERNLALREKIVAFGWLADDTVYGVVTPQALAQAQAMGLQVEGRIAPEQFRLATGRVFGRLLVNAATFALARRWPDFSAHRRLTGGQAFAGGCVLASVALGITLAPDLLLTVLQLLGLLAFLLIIGLRLLSLLPLPTTPGVIAPLLPDAALPTYTVLVPLFRETAVLRQLLHSLHLLDYPRDKLDIKLLLEEDDRPMHSALAQMQLPPQFDIIIVGHGKPQTKPRALNLGLLHARGELVTIFDAEDLPQPNQLRLAAAQFAAAGDSLSCLQARLTFYNPSENWLTRHFATEYATLFWVMLPCLAAYGLPLPLGGTSNHFRARALQAVGGWDAFNVTEDADLGMRLRRLGHGTAMLDSTTFEEANVHLGNWMRQRRRWLKGFLQTGLLHNRSPLATLRDLGPAGFLVLQATTLGVFLSCLLHPPLLLLTAWQCAMLLANPNVHADTPFQVLLAGGSLAVLVSGYMVAMAAAVRGMRCIGLKVDAYIVSTIPVYWLLQSVAAWAALWDFVVRPFHWHKTRHGLSRMFKRPPLR